MNLDNMFKLIKSKGLTAAQVSADTGISTSVLSDWKNGKAVPTVTKLELIADYFDCTVDYLIGRENATYSPEKEPVKYTGELENFVPSWDKVKITEKKGSAQSEMYGIKLLRLKQILKRYGGYGINTSDRLQCVIQDIREIQKILNIPFYNIKDDRMEQDIFLSIIENYPFLLNQAKKDNFIGYVQEQNIITLDKMSIYNKDISFDRQDSLCLELHRLTDRAEKCEYEEEYKTNIFVPCACEYFQRVLCPVCLRKYKWNINEFTEKALCPQCRSRIENYKKQRDEKEYCSICLEEKIVMSYTYLWGYIEGFSYRDLADNNAKRYTEVIKKVISILLYEIKRLKDGYGYEKHLV